MFQKNEFKAEVVRRNLTLENVATAIGIDAATLHRKMNGVSDFYRSEIEKIIITDSLPENWTYPLIQPILIKQAEKLGFM